MVVLQPLKPCLKRGVRARRALSLLLGPNDPQANLRMAESLLTISDTDFARKYNFDPVRGVPMEGGRFQWAPVTPPTPTTAVPEGGEGVRAECRVVVTTLEAGRPTCITRPSPPTMAARPSTPTMPARSQTPTQDASARPQAQESTTRPQTPSQDVSTRPQSQETTTRPQTPAQDATTAPTREETPTERTTTPPTPTEDSTSTTPTNLSLRQTCITDFARPRKRRAVLESRPHHHAPPTKKPLLQLRA